MSTDAELEHLDGRAPDPARLTHALDFRGLYGPQVDKALGGVEPMVDEWEAGRLEPEPWQVVELARLTRYPLEWFYRREPLGVAFLCARGAKGSAVLTTDPDPPPAIRAELGQRADEYSRRRRSSATVDPPAQGQLPL